MRIVSYLVSRKSGAWSLRILVTVKPRMYRETLALALLEHRPDAEVLLAPADSLDGEVADFGPDLLVRSDDDGVAPEHLNAIACRIEILYSDGMGARINLDGRVREIEDMCVDDLFAILDEVEEFISRESTGL
jgi:hypothetical protein